MRVTRSRAPHSRTLLRNADSAHTHNGGEAESCNPKGRGRCSGFNGKKQCCANGPPSRGGSDPVSSGCGTQPFSRDTRLVMKANENMIHNEDNLSPSDVEELCRRRQQLRYGIETSLARMAELRLLIDSLNDCIEKNKKQTPVNKIDSLIDHRPLEVEWNKRSNKYRPDEYTRLTEDEYYEELGFQLTAACAALSAVPPSSWRELYAFRQPPLVVTTLMTVVMRVLGYSQNLLGKFSSSSCTFNSTRWPELPQELIRCEPLKAFKNIVDAGGNVSGNDDCAERKRRYSELRRCLSFWTYDRASRAHATLGPIHRWVSAMLDISEVAGRRETSVSVNALCEDVDAVGCGTTEDTENRVAMLQELEENESYVQLAKDEISAIDALLADVAALAVNRPVTCTPIPDAQRAQSSDSSPLNETQLPTSELNSTENAGMVLVDHMKQKGEQCDLNGHQIMLNTEDGPYQSRFTPSTLRCFSASEGPVSLSLTATPSIPLLKLESLKVASPASKINQLSIRDRFETLRSLPPPQTPRVGNSFSFDSVPVCGSFGSTLCSAFSPKDSSSNVLNSARVLQDRENLLIRVHQLEEQLQELRNNSPLAAELQRLRDEVQMSREEISTLRAERDYLREQVEWARLCGDSSSPGACLSNHCVDVSAAKSRVKNVCIQATSTWDTEAITHLKSQLNEAHVHTQQLQGTLSSVMPAVKGVSPLTGCSYECIEGLNVSPDSISASSGGGLIQRAKVAYYDLDKAQVVHQRLEEMQQELEARQRTIEEVEERLNEEIHARNDASQQVQHLQAELHRVWQRLGSAEHQLKLALENSENGSVRSHDNHPDTEESTSGQYYHEDDLDSVLRPYRQREALYQQKIEQLCVQLERLKRRHAEERRRRREIREMRAALLQKLEDTFSEVLCRQEFDLSSMPEVLERTRERVEQLVRRD
ncbi:hypothetical protein ERJ75_000357300 [Trypanosoma vivax]|uniref:Uncharacterized protein n=1 Tax=Trypanosoma vivax (strain Y486) TaxID=1055687 RepID=F9WQ16_TRYVY|nr:hypothetical protein TRVL_04277 [Trypanosoma vivax]KAH8617661.1 hypothetical protein ERJ75_000357300 [Trypanosoma vivax]CCD19644.1 hypothetical protein, conserved [Trypanosoma vivax Y486]|eukprot:CCD19644.1 hypothetical protein, conserved [Trypanosoma vivax Y486]